MQAIDRGQTHKIKYIVDGAFGISFIRMRHHFLRHIGALHRLRRPNRACYF